MKIEFELNDTQTSALKDIMVFIKDKAMTEQELAKQVFVDFVIKNKQELLRQELR